MSKKRCEWCNGFYQAYVDYHDREWGVPVHDDQKHFEFLILEGAQAGLSWSTVLQKRQGYKQQFYDFDVQKVASISEEERDQILGSPTIIRNRLKVNSAINNAQKFIEIQNEYGSFDNYIWRFVDGKVIQGYWKTMAQVPATTQQSDALSKDLKKRGFKFVGSTIIYAHMQATGLVNDHTTDCYRFEELLNGLNN